MTHRVIATVFALCAFTAAILYGLQAGNPPTTLIINASLVMAVCYLLGLAVGYVAHEAIKEHIRNHQEKNPIPQDLDVMDGIEEPGRSGPVESLGEL